MGQILEGFYQGNIHLRDFNKANMVMIPKKEEAIQTTDYRPISIINIIPKLIAKILANRLRGKMPSLISPNQAAFIQGRQITENFVTTRETLQHIAATGKSAIFLKIDLAKAFDSIE